MAKDSNIPFSSPEEASAWSALRDAQLNEHVGAMASSAKLCANDAQQLFDAGDFARCKARALRSLSYSLGVFSPVYQRHA